MDQHVFTEVVRQHAGFETPDEAARTIEAVLEALSESIARGEAIDAAEQLPEEFAEHLLVDETENVEPLDYPEFLDRVSDEAGLDRDVALSRVQAVMLALNRSLDEFEYESIHGQLPAEYDPLFDEDAIDTELALADALAVELGLDESAARAAAEAVLETLSERLTLGEIRDIAAYLTEQEAATLVDRESPDAADFDADEFVERVADREGVDEETGRGHTRQVFRTLDDFAPEEMERATEQLGPGYAELLPRP